MLCMQCREVLPTDAPCEGCGEAERRPFDSDLAEALFEESNSKSKFRSRSKSRSRAKSRAKLELKPLPKTKDYSAIWLIFAPFFGAMVGGLLLAVIALVDLLWWLVFTSQLFDMGKHFLTVLATCMVLAILATLVWLMDRKKRPKRKLKPPHAARPPSKLTSHEGYIACESSRAVSGYAALLGGVVVARLARAAELQIENDDVVVRLPAGRVRLCGSPQYDKHGEGDDVQQGKLWPGPEVVHQQVAELCLAPGDQVRIHAELMTVARSESNKAETRQLLRVCGTPWLELIERTP